MKPWRLKAAFPRLPLIIEFFKRFGSKLITAQVFEDCGEVAGASGVRDEGFRRVVHRNQSQGVRNGRAYCLRAFSQAGVCDSIRRWVKGFAGEITASCNNVHELKIARIGPQA